jgi:hypothetical protein
MEASACTVCQGPIRGHNKIGICSGSYECKRANNAAWRAENPEVGRAWRAENPARERARRSQRRAEKRHGMTRPDYEAYLAQGCAIEGCVNPATQIDHDHTICSKNKHSCIKCRRGPLCTGHNARHIAAIDKLLTGGYQAELEYLNLSVTFHSLSTSSTEATNV